MKKLNSIPNMKHFKFFVFVLIVTSYAFGGDDNGPKSLEKAIKVRGAEAVYRGITNDPKVWKEVTSGIATANTDWLAVYKSIESYSDTSFAEDLQISLSKALSTNPDRVLSDVLNGERFASTSLVCGRVDDDIDEGEILPFLKNQRARVAAVKSAQLIKIKQKCLSAIDKAISFQQKKTGH